MSDENKLPESEQAKRERDREALPDSLSNARGTGRVSQAPAPIKPGDGAGASVTRTPKAPAPDYAYWSLMATWTKREFAALSLDLDPAAVTELSHHDALAEAYYRLKEMIDRAMSDGQLGNSHSDSRRPREFLEWAKGRITVSQELETNVETVSGPLLDQDRRCAELQSANALLQTENQRLQSERPRWPWGNHETRKLKLLAMAGVRFWKDHDAKRLAPKNDEVVNFLKEEGLGQTPAEEMASILRGDDVPAGPRTRRQET